MPYRVEIKASARKEIAALPRRDGFRIMDAINALALDPRPTGARKLKGALDAYRISKDVYRDL